MFGPKIWDFYAGWYDKLWVQKIVLTPSLQLIMKTIEELPSPGQILDVGCGIGELTHLISLQYPSAKIIGIDPSVKMINRARDSYSGNNIKYISGLVNSLPKDKKFDLIVSTHAFPYMQDKRKFLTDSNSMLTPNGRLLLLFTNRNNLYDTLILSIVKLTTSKAQYLSTSSTQNLLQSCGFTVVRTKPIKSLFFVPSVFMIECIVPNAQS